MIPRTIHRIWVGSEMPEEFKGYGQRWKELHPGWQVIDWTQLPDLINQDLYDLAPSPSVGQFRADVARYELLWRYGGVYADCDMEPLKPLDGLLEGVSLFAAREDDYWINNALMGCLPGDKFLGLLIKGLPSSVKANSGKGPNVASGPQYLTGMFHKFRPEMTVFPPSHFYPYSFRELHREDESFPDAYAVHRWNHRRARRRASQPAGARI